MPDQLPDSPWAETARLALACLDLTRLNDDDTAAGIEQLCARARTPFGDVAAVCVWPRWAALALHALPGTIRVAAVANFPDGSASVERIEQDIAAAAGAGAREVDVVLPWRALLAGDLTACERALAVARRASRGLLLKVILETGELRSDAAIALACDIALAQGADFLKTSTGKSPVGATPEAARVMLRAMAACSRSSVGFKVSGGVRTVADAAIYLGLVREWLGPGACVPGRFRIGASGLLDDIEAVLGGQRKVAATGGGY